jgi:F-type H+-transporting ATPase subunit d
LGHYKTVLKDQRAVQEAEKALSAFKPVGYEVDKWNGVVEAFEGKAVRLRGLSRAKCPWVRKH